jgi:UDP-GlcNAc:undecaprenyl-phosphate GlcNAc-1-phosphate transferase
MPVLVYPTHVSILATALLALALGVGLETVGRRFGLVDHPGGRKAHVAPVPLVGGIAIFFSFVLTALLFGSPAASFVAAAAFVVTVGIIDDAFTVGPLTRFLSQISASLMMVLVGGVELRSLGDLLGLGAIGLSFFALAMTVFAAVGVMNALNMLDGIDGLAGSVSLIALGWFALVAHLQGLTPSFWLAATIAGALAGFLALNLRMPWRGRARIFLGDAGSMLLGFTLAWLAVDLTQGSNRTMAPICALWIVLLPLADCVSLMTRRIRAGKSPFAADSRHLHHYLRARGFTHGQTLATLLAASTFFGAVGFFGWRLGVPEPYLFWTFFFLFFGYHLWIRREWKRIESAAPPQPMAVGGDGKQEKALAS